MQQNNLIDIHSHFTNNLDTTRENDENKQKYADITELKEINDGILRETIKVGVIRKSPYVSSLTVFDGDSKYRTSDGVMYEIFQEAMKLPRDKWSIQYIYLDDVTNTEAVNRLESGEFDMLIGGITLTALREKKVNFTKTLMLGRNVVLFKGSSNIYVSFAKGLLKNIWMPLIVMTLIALIFGFLLSYFDKRRGGLLQGAWAIVSGMYAEPGILATETSQSTIALILSGFGMLLAYYYSVFLQSYTVGEVINDSRGEDPFLNTSNFKGKKILMSRKYGPAEYIESLGATIVTPEKKQTDLIAYYLSNHKNYDGVVTDIHVGKTATDKYSNVYISNADLGFNELAFAINPRRQTLLHKMNKLLYTLEENGVIYSKCEKYFKDDIELCQI